ncbi:hypothetical protein Ari01nite_44470 [Paractinoplanes rishiriensis]|uniref:DUF4245 domain-containing protein n=2 Tax=Paractinoplanes rishiriensis TaxID=1050105 RepID=A0A919N1I1_9ACTN|nr:hypothetical protein Ari01nite_44470 [Actinoplanes rishiriensis]
MLSQDWDIPVTEAFVDRVRRGVRRRRRVRVLGAGGAAVAVLAAVFLLWPAMRQAPTMVATNPPAVGGLLDGVSITHLPAGAVRVKRDSTSSQTLADLGASSLIDVPTPPAGAWATTATRRFDRGVGVGLFVTVMRPLPPEPPVTAAQVGEWLASWAALGTRPVRAFEVPAGHARTVAHGSSNYEVVITTPDHVVITVGGNAAFSAAEMEEVARGLR